MASARYLTEIKSKMGLCQQIEENDLKMLHMNSPVGDWREWMILSYDQNVLGELLLKENQFLKIKIEEMEKKLSMLPSFSVAAQPPPAAVWPHLVCPSGRSLQVESPTKAEN